MRTLTRLAHRCPPLPAKAVHELRPALLRGAVTALLAASAALVAERAAAQDYEFPGLELLGRVEDSPFKDSPTERPQNLDAPPSQDEEAFPLPRLALTGAFAARTESNVGPTGEIQVYDTRAGALLRQPIGAELSAYAGFSYGFGEYNFSPDALYGWDGIHTFLLSGLLGWRLDPQWVLFAGPVVRWSFEEGAEPNDSITAGAVGGFRYFVEENLTIGLAVGVVDQIEDDYSLAVWPIVDWEFWTDLRLRMGPMDHGARLGLGAEVVWEFLPGFDAGAGIMYSKRRFLLKEGDAVGQDISVPITFQFGWTPSESVRLEALIGVVTAGSVRLENSDGRKVRDTTYHPAAIFGIQAELSF